MNRLRVVVAAMILTGCGTVDTSARDLSPLRFSILGGSYFDPPEIPHIALILQTETTYPCLTYQLESTLGVAGNVVRVDVSGRILKPDNCWPATGPAQFRAPLIIANGTYALEFRRSGLTDRYAVTVTNTAIDVVAVGAPQFTRPTASHFPRD